MKLPHDLRDSVRTRLFKSWLILGASAIAASFFVLLLLISFERRNQAHRLTDDLRIKASTAARRVSAELLVGDRGNVGPVISGLLQELSIDRIELLPPGLSCTSDPSIDACRVVLQDALAWVEERLPHLPEEQYLLVAQEKALLSAALPWTTVFVGIFSLLTVLLGGIFLQWSAIRKHLLEPVNALLESGEKSKEAHDWPIEIRRLECKLQCLLEERDRATHEAHRLKTEAMVQDLSQRILHDLKAPLGTLGMMIETDLKDVPAETKDSIRRVLGRIRAIVDTNLKEYSASATLRPAAPTTTPTKTEKPSSTIGGAIRTIADEEQPKAASKGIELVYDISRNVYRIFAPISFSELCRALSNLITNAIDSAEGGRKRVYVTARQTGDSCDVAIRDFGTGFDPEALRRFQQGQRGTTKPNGNGLGLLTAKSLLESAGGSLEIQTFNDGALVRLRLPIRGSPTWFRDITNVQSETILALDDDATIGGRLAASFPEREIKLFQKEEEFLKNVEEDRAALLLVDYDFGGNRTGMDLILQHGLTRRAVLLSGKIAFDAKLRYLAEANEVRMFPKECLA